MAADPDTPTPAEIEEFLNGTLPEARRAGLAAHLSGDAGAAAHLMADLHQTEGLRAAQPALPPAPELERAARRLGRAMQRRRLMRALVLPGTAAACLALGWFGHGLWQGAGRPHAALAPLAETALDAQRAVVLARGLSGGAMLPPDALSAAAERVGVALPTLPGDWTVRAVQVVATPDRPALLVQIDTPAMGAVALFSVAGSDLGPDAPPAGFALDGAAVAVFERAASAHVLLDAAGSPAEVAREAGRLVTRVN
jgi:hypothetical protein